MANPMETEVVEVDVEVEEKDDRREEMKPFFRPTSAFLHAISIDWISSKC